MLVKKERIANISLFILILAFLVIKITQISYRFSDESIYFYMGKIVMEGAIPYKDFYFASPPLQIYLLGTIGLFIGKNYILLKLLPIATTVITSLLLYLVIKKINNDSWKAVVAVALFLFSSLTLITTDYETGVHLTTMFVIAMIYFIYDGKHFLAGFMASLALLTRLYSPFPVFGAFAYLLIFERKGILKFLAGCSVFILVFLVMNTVSQGSMIQDIIFSKLKYISAEFIPKTSILLEIVKSDWLLVVSSLAFLIIGDKKRFALPLLTFVSTCVFYMIFSDLYYMYFVLIIPLLCIFGSESIAKILRQIRNKAGNKKAKMAIILLTAIIISVAVLNTAHYLNKYSAVGKIYFIDDIVEHVKQNSATDETIYGEYGITPIIALLSNRKISHNMIDTMDKNFLIGIFNATERTELMRDDARFIMAKVKTDGNAITEVQYFIDRDFIRDCKKVKIYPIKDELDYDALVVWDCKPKIWLNQ
jgi:hypothetical protein